MRRFLLVALSLLAVLVLGVVVLFVVVAPSGTVTSDGGTHRVDLPMLTVRVADPEPLLESPDQFLGVPHPAPAFDTSVLGADLSLVPDPGGLQPLDSTEVLRAVYLGDDVDGEPYYIWHVGSRNLVQMIGQVFADFGSVGRLGTSYDTLTTGDGIFSRGLEESLPESGMTSGFLTTSTGEPTTLVAEWHGLPEEVSVVVFYEGEVPIGWQRVVSETAALEREYEPEDLAAASDGVSMVALTVEGDEWGREPLFGPDVFAAYGNRDE